MKGPIFLFCGTPAAGKSTMVKGLLEQCPFVLRIPVHTQSHGMVYYRGKYKSQDSGLESKVHHHK